MKQFVYLVLVLLISLFGVRKKTQLPDDFVLWRFSAMTSLFLKLTFRIVCLLNLFSFKCILSVTMLFHFCIFQRVARLEANRSLLCVAERIVSVKQRATFDTRFALAELCCDECKFLYFFEAFINVKIYGRGLCRLAAPRWAFRPIHRSRACYGESADHHFRFVSQNLCARSNCYLIATKRILELNELDAHINRKIRFRSRPMFH